MSEEIKVVNIEEQEVEETKQNTKDDKQVKTTVFTLGEIILKLKMPENFVEAVNKAIDEINDHNKYVKPEKRYF